MSIVEPADAFAGARPVAPFAPLDVFPPGARAVWDAGAGRCRWPLGEVAEDRFRFCDEPQARGSYCAAHTRLSRKGRAR